MGKERQGSTLYGHFTEMSVIYIEVSVKRESVLTCSLALYLQWKTDDQSGFWCN